MKPICRLLLIEDDPLQARTLERECCPDPANAAIEVATNGAEAERALRAGEYDLIICDLALPSDARQFEPDTSEGLRLFELIREQSQGTPVIVLSAQADLHMMQNFFKASRDGDLYGTQTEQPLVQFYAKWDLPDCVDAVQTHIARTSTLDGLELEFPTGLPYSMSDERALKIYGRRTGATRGLVERLDGGLSDAKTLKVSFTDSDGSSTGTVVAKLGSLHRVMNEWGKYNQLAAKLPVGLGAHVLFAVQAGAGQRGALIYQLADEYKSLFGMVADRDPAAVLAATRLRERLTGWVDGAPIVVRSLADLRRPLVSDLELRRAGTTVPDERDVEVNVRETIAHGDLHGLNVLVSNTNEPTLIDYGEVRRANAGLDPITLELSIVYHPAMEGKLGGWPSAAHASAWHDIDAYCDGCPVEEFVRICRAWAYDVSAGQEEVLATAYAYSMRQLKYGGSAVPLAMALAHGVYTVLGVP
jgi:CheY-like chemotaxis protein